MNIQTSFNEQVDEDLQATWRLDAENSRAEFSYDEVKNNGDSCFLYKAEIEIRPYPNPYVFGGMWANGSCKTLKELNKVRQNLMAYVNRFKPHGLVKISIQK